MNADIMFADRRRTVVESGSGALEVIVPDADAAVRWASHGYPNSLAKWHHHPQIEFHLIREGSGLMMVGDCVVPCRAGHVALIGSNLPHNWVSDVKPGERLARRDVLCHVRPQTVKALMACFPETARFNLVLRRAARAMVLSGESAQAAGALLEGMGDHDPARRVADLIELFGVFADAPETEAHTVVTPGYDLELSSDTERTVNEAIAYVTENLAGEISLEEAARLVSMSPSAFSRFFKRAAGIGFSDFVRRLRNVCWPQRIARWPGSGRNAGTTMRRISTGAFWTRRERRRRRIERLIGRRGGNPVITPIGDFADGRSHDKPTKIK